ncbi:hypothetical protein niasHT_004636 [Heterodera trifolii]|uniref:Uncharacterized protein n=1 Tax=Heterodera trifolii TaxID=157864 RepID=A0ABD2M7I4_9BILA
MTDKEKVLITGANQGIGLHTALLMAKNGNFEITLACRDEKRARGAMQQLKKENSNVQVQWMEVDLAQLDSVRDMVKLIQERKIFFDIVILNAGVLLPKTEKTADGNEHTFQVNFLAQFLLIDGIIGHQCPAKPIRVVTLTSLLYRFCGKIIPVKKDPSQWGPMFEGARRWKAYALSKFAMALLAQHLNTREGVKAFTVHPGTVKTQMAEAVGSKTFRKCLFFLKCILIKPETAAENVLFCVHNDMGPNEYRYGNRVKKLSVLACNKNNADALIRLALQMIVPSSVAFRCGGQSMK